MLVGKDAVGRLVQGVQTWPSASRAIIFRRKSKITPSVIVMMVLERFSIRWANSRGRSLKSVPPSAIFSHML